MRSSSCQVVWRVEVESLEFKSLVLALSCLWLVRQVETMETRGSSATLPRPATFSAHPPQLTGHGHNTSSRISHNLHTPTRNSTKARSVALGNRVARDLLPEVGKFPPVSSSCRVPPLASEPPKIVAVDKATSRATLSVLDDKGSRFVALVFHSIATSFMCSA